MYQKNIPSEIFSLTLGRSKKPINTFENVSSIVQFKKVRSGLKILKKEKNKTKEKESNKTKSKAKKAKLKKKIKTLWVRRKKTKSNL